MSRFPGRRSLKPVCAWPKVIGHSPKLIGGSRSRSAPLHNPSPLAKTHRPRSSTYRRLPGSRRRPPMAFGSSLYMVVACLYISARSRWLTGTRRTTSETRRKVGEAPMALAARLQFAATPRSSWRRADRLRRAPTGCGEMPIDFRDSGKSHAKRPWVRRSGKGYREDSKVLRRRGEGFRRTATG